MTLNKAYQPCNSRGKAFRRQLAKEVICFIYLSMNKIIVYHINLGQALMTGMLGSLQLKWYSNTEKGPALLYQYCFVDC